MAIVEHDLVIEGDHDAWLWNSDLVECDYCEGTGMVVDNATEEMIDCPRCDGFCHILVPGPSDDLG